MRPKFESIGIKVASPDCELVNIWKSTFINCFGKRDRYFVTGSADGCHRGSASIDRALKHIGKVLCSGHCCDSSETIGSTRQG